MRSTIWAVLAGILMAACGGEPGDPETNEEAVGAGYVALCKDGTYSDNTEFDDTCSSHDEVDKWLATYGECGDGDIVRMSTSASCDDGFEGLLPADYAPEPGEGDIAQCKDGTFSDNPELRNTCSSHDGVDRWLAEYGECGDGTVIEMSASSSCVGKAGFERLLPDYEPPPQPTEPPPPPEPEVSPVEEWADEHLDDLANVHGSMVGVVNATGSLLEAGSISDATAVCSSAVDAPFLTEAEPAIAEYPGEEDFAGSWATFRSASNDLFEACASEEILSNGSFAEALGVWEAADAGLSLSVIVAISEIDGGQVNPDSPYVTGYDDAPLAVRFGVADEWTINQ